ncbi:MAG TPA: hypothetical protein VGC62_05400 [Pseudomonas sp.]
MPQHSANTQFHHQSDHMKLLIALRRALNTDAKTPTHAQAVGVKTVHH